MNNYIKLGSIPPKSKYDLSSPNELISRLTCLINTNFPLSGKPRTDGSNFRKLITNTLLEQHRPEIANKNSYNIVPPKSKGVPKFLLEYIDTYIVTSGDTYNLQVWNRNPNSDFIQVDYFNEESLSASDVRFVLGKINLNTQTIESIIIMTPNYIENMYGKFGKPTIKQQLIIPNNMRSNIINSDIKILFENDCLSISKYIDPSCNTIPSNISIKDNPTKIFPLSYLRDVLLNELLGTYLDPSLSTKQRGQLLESLIANKLGYTLSDQPLDGNYPDIRNQMLEVKVQDSPTIDLGKYSPQFTENIYEDFTTKNIRYLIALTNPNTGIIEGIILCPGFSLGKYFSYVSDKSFKCQKSIPLDIFKKYSGKVVFNPKL